MRCEVTYEELALLDAGEVDDGRAGELAAHVAACAECGRRLDDLREADTVMTGLRREEPSAAAVLETRRALSREVRGCGEPEIMTLDEAAEFLRVDARELDIQEWGLPVFEIGGRLRVRRARLVEWIEQRERAFARGSAASEVARIVGGDFGKGVA
ncbi:MAG: anti-sigma factor [Planctomycetota bacterium]|jgi:hypothetical protein